MRHRVTHEHIVLDADFEKCELSGYVVASVLLNKEYFSNVEEYNDLNECYRIGFNLPILGSENNNFKIHRVSVDGIDTKFSKRQAYLKRFKMNFSSLADLHNFEVL